MRIAVDAAGPEPAPDIVIKGTLEAWREARQSSNVIYPVFYGPSDTIRQILYAEGEEPDEFEVVHAPDIVQADDVPSDVISLKTASSIVRAVQHLATGAVSAFVSMGNTGAVVASARAYLGRLRWVSKPALAAPLPRNGEPGLLLDVGATSDPRNSHLLQFAAMGAAFSELVYRISNPKVGLLNIGSEPHKGDELAREAYRQLSRSPLHFIGNVEGGDLFTGKADVIVCSGMVGNTLIKFAESIPFLLRERVGNEPWFPRLLGALKDLDYARYGGATLLGVDGPVIIGHGRSGAGAVRRALFWAREMVRADMTRVLKDSVFRVRRAHWLTNPFSRMEGSEEDG
ncbi:phosphate--acyl-ACP acyltransferase [bacterium]|nr:phosphate--acyl-ACP acyltransferase [bacterium]